MELAPNVFLGGGVEKTLSQQLRGQESGRRHTAGSFI